MHLTCRLAFKRDFAAFFEGCFPPGPLTPGLREAVEHEWHVFIDNPATITMLIEDQERPPVHRIVGIGQMVFVTDRFVGWLRAGQSPYANEHASRALPDGSWPLLSLQEVREGNSRGGLNGLVTRWSWSENGLSSVEQFRVRDYLDLTFPLLLRGYHYKELLLDVGGDWNLEAILKTGLKLRNDYTAFPGPHFPPPPGKAPHLVGVTREEALAEEGYQICRMFSYIPPRFFLRPHEQEMLQLVLLGLSDEEVVDRCGITRTGAKKRWTAIYERVCDAVPDLLPAAHGTGRGPEKRARLLQYLREHPEELRPHL